MNNQIYSVFDFYNQIKEKDQFKFSGDNFYHGNIFLQKTSYEYCNKDRLGGAVFEVNGVGGSLWKVSGSIENGFELTPQLETNCHRQSPFFNFRINYYYGK